MEERICSIRVSDFLENEIPVRAKTYGTSMLPFIRSGDYLVIQPVSAKVLRTGDILAYSYDKKMSVVCHRLVKIDNLRLITKGDTHIKGYEVVLFDNLLGRVSLIERGRIKINLETDFQKALAGKMAWVSLNAPALLYFIAYVIEVFRTPKILLHRMRRFFKEAFSPRISK